MPSIKPQCDRDLTGLPPRSNRRYNRHIYKEQHLVASFLPKIKKYKRLATRYKKLATTFACMVIIASCLLWLK